MEREKEKQEFTVAEVMLMLGNNDTPAIISVGEARELLGLPIFPVGLDEPEMLYKKIKIMDGQPAPPTEDGAGWVKEMPQLTTATQIWFSINNGDGWEIPMLLSRDHCSS